MKVSVNVHPQTGVDHCDSRYPQFAILNGVDPATNATIPCDFGNKTFMDALYKVYMDALPLQAIDIFWTDYGGCGLSGNNPQLWNNMVIYQHMENARGVRGQAFSRYGGVGNHRSPHGFSGDTFMHEVALYWQVKTTQTAANVMWGYWSHDIGGFHTGQGAPGDADPGNVTGSELLLRWIQWGAVAPILRTHCDHCERRIWMFPHFQYMRDALRLRNALGPYIYTEARAFFDSGVAPVHPLYYESPQDATLYTPGVVESEFMHGSRLLAAPITKVMEGSPTTPPPTLPWPIYLPDPGPGNTAWSDWNGTSLYSGGGSVPGTVNYSVGDIPLFVRGGILPLKTMDSVASAFPDPLVWALFPGSPVGGYTLYEDDGDSPAYVGGEFVTTPVALTWVVAGVGQPQPPTAITFTVSPSQAGEALPPGFPQTRTHALQVRGVGVQGGGGAAPKAVTVNGVALPPMDPSSPGVGWYIANNHTLAETLGSLVVVGPPTSSWATTTFSISW
jgi:alpha-glucosidase (family GH31 glycosyl hydrolase)